MGIDVDTVIATARRRGSLVASERWLPGFTAAWGLWLLAPWDTFSGAPGWAAMAAVMPEWAWGLLLLALGSAHLALAQRHAPLVWRRVLNAIGAAVWFGIAIGFGLSSPTGTGFLTYTFIALLKARLFWLLSQEAKA